MNVSHELHKAVFAALDDALSVPVLDQHPQQQNYPFVTLSDDDDARAFDTDTTVGGDVLFHVHGWSRYPGSAELRGIMTEVYDTLTRQPLAVAGANLLTIEFVNQTIFRDTDGKTRHAVAQFRALLVQE